MKLYNSATRTKEEFVTNRPDIVKMYTCGPTVNHYANIGNPRSSTMAVTSLPFSAALISACTIWESLAMRYRVILMLTTSGSEPAFISMRMNGRMLWYG